ncbi:MAG: plastocyanin/azurin family copper-binding protein [Candidatus Caldarchaeales archaeon]
MRADQTLAIAIAVFFVFGMLSLQFVKEVPKQPGPAGKETVAATRPLMKVTVIIRPGSFIDGTHPTYDPPSVKVRLGVNNTVVWVNKEEVDVKHDVTHEPCFRHEPNCIQSFKSSLFSPGETFVYTFVLAGEYKYVCAAHPWMKGEVIVRV